jgi:NitT/TauT family transport system substrate-binding protein
MIDAVMMLSRRLVLSAAMSSAILPGRIADAAPAQIRAGTLQAGSFAWELDVIRHNGFDRALGIVIDATSYPSQQDMQAALQEGRADVVMLDWLWVAGKRADGGDWTCAPASTAAGGIVAPASSPIKAVTDLPGTRLGVVGGALDKNWLILQAHAKRIHNIDLEQSVHRTYADAQTLADAVAAGSLDAVLTHWPFVAKAQAAGQTQIIGVESADRELGIEGKVPFSSLVFSSDWAAANPLKINGVLAAAAAARKQLETSDAEWQRLRPLTGAGSTLELDKLKAAYRGGLIHGDGEIEKQAAIKLYQVLAEIGGLALVGTSSIVPAGTFWQPPR